MTRLPVPRLTQALGLLALASLTPVAAAALTLTTLADPANPGQPQYRVDTGGGLVFTVRGSGAGGAVKQPPGDITSLVYKGVDYQYKARGSHVNSGAHALYTGVGAVDVKAEMFSDGGAPTPAPGKVGAQLKGGAYIKITVSSVSMDGKVFKHCYMARHGQPHIYMGTYFEAEPTAEPYVRFVVRVPRQLLPYGPAGEPGAAGSALPDGGWAQDMSEAATLVEAQDIYAVASGPRQGQTRAKHYANARQMDWRFLGGRNGPNATASTVGIWLHTDNVEGSSGGPFYRSLLQQIGLPKTGDTNELTYIVNYGMAQTEPYRLGTLNTYTLLFTDGAAPVTPPPTSWFAKVQLPGFVGPEGRGAVSGLGLAGTDPAYRYTVGLANARAQYWAPVSTDNTRFGRSGMLPGDYTLTVYKNELPVYTSPAPVTVAAGTNNILHTLTINKDPSADTALWRIGDWDGTPREFLNGSRLTTMHPSDVRMNPWSPPGPYVVGTSAPGTGWPAYQWKDVNGRLAIQFTLPAGQPGPMTLRVGTTTEFLSAVPQVSVNNGRWVSPLPAERPPHLSRNLTVGTYRGVNRLYAFEIPAAALQAGSNQIELSVASGAGGSSFLSPGLAYDAIDLLPRH